MAADRGCQEIFLGAISWLNKLEDNRLGVIKHAQAKLAKILFKPAKILYFLTELIYTYMRMCLYQYEKEKRHNPTPGF